MPKLPNIAAPQVTTKTRGLRERVTLLKSLLGLLCPAPSAWLTRNTGSLKSVQPNSGGTSDYSSDMVLKSCSSYAELVKAWEEAMKWSEGLDSALAAMLASSMSTQFIGEQLWLKIIGPPSSGKTSLMEGLATARKWYLSKDTIRGFHSGAKREDGEETLAQLVNGKTLGIKDGDTLLKSPNLKQILSEGRALYDRVSRTDYRNFVRDEYMGHRMTWHLAGTASLREIDDSELGARFLDVVVMDGIDDEFEDMVAMRSAIQEARNMTVLSDGKPESQHPTELANAMALSGGYLDFLRENALDLSCAVQPDESCFKLFSRLGKFVAYMRARPSRDRDSDPEREFSPRLVKQLTRLAISLSGVFGHQRVEDRAVQLTHRVAMDTSRGRTLDLVKVLVNIPQGIEARGLSALMHVSDERLRSQLKFLRKIGITQMGVDGGGGKRWRLTPKMSELYGEVEHV